MRLYHHLSAFRVADQCVQQSFHTVFNQVERPFKVGGAAILGVGRGFGGDDAVIVVVHDHNAVEMLEV